MDCPCSKDNDNGNNGNGWSSTNGVTNSQVYKTMNKLFKVVNKATDMLTSCQKGQPCYIAELKAAYDKAKYDLSTDPSRVKQTRKDYIVAKDGELEYERLMKEEAIQTAEQDILKLIDEYVNQLRGVYTQTEALGVAEDGYTYIDGVLVQTIANNALSEQYLKKSINKVLTNDRKSYYEQDKYNDLKSWNRIWFWSYLFLWVVFILSLFLTTNLYSYLSIMSKVGFILSFIIYLFVAKYIVLLLISFIVFCITLFPKNVYLQM